MAKAPVTPPVIDPELGLRGGLPVLNGQYVTDTQSVSDRYNYSPESVVVDPKKPGDSTAAITRQKMQFYQGFYDPLLRDNVERLLNDTSLVDEARKNARTGFRDQAARDKRQMERFNMLGGRPPAIRQQANRERGLARALNYDGAVNTARMNAFDRSQALQDDILNIMNGIDSNSLQGLQSASANQNQRQIANANSSAAASAANNQTIGQLAMMAAMFMM